MNDLAISNLFQLIHIAVSFIGWSLLITGVYKFMAQEARWIPPGDEDHPE